MFLDIELKRHIKWIYISTFTKAALVWYRSFKSHLITSWPQFTELFVTNSNASRVKPKSEKTLRVIRQRENETIREYKQRFNEEAQNVYGLEDKMRWH